MIDFSKYPIAFDIGTHDIHALQLERKTSRFRIRALSYEKLDNGLTDIEKSGPDLIKTLKAIKKNKEFSGNRAVVHIPAHLVMSFPIEFTVDPKDSIEDAIVREVEQHLPYPLEDAVIDYPSISQLPGEDIQRAVIVSARRSHIEAILSLFKKAGFQTELMGYRPISSIRLHQHLFNVTDKPSVICYVGREESGVQIFNNQRILAMNKFSWGLDPLIKKLNITLGFKETTSNAIALLRQHGIHGAGKNHTSPIMGDPLSAKAEGIVSRIIAPPMEELVFEFHKIIGYIRNKEHIHGINDISFYGLAPKINGLDQYIQNRMNIPAKTVNLLDQIDIREKIIEAGYHDIIPFAAALGLAMGKIPWL